LELPSPISDYSSLGEEEDFFDQEPLINPWVIPTAFNSDPISPTPLWSNTAAGTSLTMKNHNSISSPESSRSNSPEYVSHEDIKTKKPAPKQEGRKHPSKDCRAKSTSKSSSHKSHNMIEKRYRNNLNNKIMALRDCVPSLRKNKDGEDDDTSESGTCRRWNKVRDALSLIPFQRPFFDHKLTKMTYRAKFLKKLSIILQNWRSRRGNFRTILRGFKLMVVSAAIFMLMEYGGKKWRERTSSLNLILKIKFNVIK